MALSQLTSSDAGAAARDKINAAIAAANALVSQLAQEIQDRSNAVGAEVQSRHDNDKTIVDALNAEVGRSEAAEQALHVLIDGLTTLTGALKAAVADRSQDLYDLQKIVGEFQTSVYYVQIKLQQNIDAQGVQLRKEAAEFYNSSSTSLISEAADIRAVAAAEAKMRAANDAAETEARIAADADEVKARIAETEARIADVARLALLANRHTLYDRPGDALAGFALVGNAMSLAGPAAGLPAVPEALVVQCPYGSVLALRGATVLGTSDPVAVEPGRAYRARTALMRLTDPVDPSNDAVQFGIVWLDAGLVPLTGFVALVSQIAALRASSGRVMAEVVFGRERGDRVQLLAPNRARYARAFVRTFGASDGVTAVEVLGIADVTDAALRDPVSASVIAQVATLVSQDPGLRLDALEQAQTAPSSLTFRTRSEAVRANPAVSVTAIRLLGDAQVGDGRDGLFRPASPLPPGSDGFTCADGSTWMRVEIADSVLTDQNAGWRSRLPTAPPDAPGQPWNNGGLIDWTPEISA